MAILSAKPKTERQRWAQKRNWQKFQLKSIVSRLEALNREALPSESLRYEEALGELRIVLSRWDAKNDISRMLYREENPKNETT